MASVLFLITTTLSQVLEEDSILLIVVKSVFWMFLFLALYFQVCEFIVLGLRVLGQQ